ncbi:ParB/RepB/Spo0J family partition protein [Desulfothermobacter acidiphilus]|uniref:ParB/RepB/Spo0J family partition protein n=1 Tax=Desulfothermobacter acidiphilus TaxID=1938353 RepID=UPI003F8CB12E
MVSEVPVDLLKPHPQNEELFGKRPTGELWDAFVESVREMGIIVPLAVTPDYTVLAGHLRLEAAKEAGLETVPVVIRNVDPASPEALAFMLTENTLRRHFSPMQLAAFIRRWKEAYNIRQGGRANFGKDLEKLRKRVSEVLGVDLTDRRLRQIEKLNDLIPELQQLIFQGKLSQRAAYPLAFLLPEEQRELLKALGEAGVTELSVRQTEDLRKELEAERKKKEDLLCLVASLEEEKTRVLQEAQQKDRKAKETELSLKELEKQPEHLRQELRSAQEKAVAQVVEKVVYKPDPELERRVKREPGIRARLSFFQEPGTVGGKEMMPWPF